ncbi:homeobox domain-containing protein [Ditylenchus destructor]|uniref:Homeobox domain-containing protein n=1 Tax=Ditylenchus destructor TaxID=166010 RepID=A0AAD4MVF0_9BILA|nr:homeobox domain-containing protein [Ditylenchus destructor]
MISPFLYNCHHTNPHQTELSAAMTKFLELNLAGIWPPNHPNNTITRQPMPADMNLGAFFNPAFQPQMPSSANLLDLNPPVPGLNSVTFPSINCLAAPNAQSFENVPPAIKNEELLDSMQMPTTSMEPTLLLQPTPLDTMDNTCLLNFYDQVTPPALLSQENCFNFNTLCGAELPYSFSYNGIDHQECAIDESADTLQNRYNSYGSVVAVKSARRSRPGKKSRQARTVFTGRQLHVLEEMFDKCKYLLARDRLDLARKMGLTETQVRTWYQNRRSKWKRKSKIPTTILTDFPESPSNTDVFRTII